MIHAGGRETTPYKCFALRRCCLEWLQWWLWNRQRRQWYQQHREVERTKQGNGLDVVVGDNAGSGHQHNAHSEKQLPINTKGYIPQTTHSI